MASADRFENGYEFLPLLMLVIKLSTGTGFVHKERGRKWRLKLAQEQAPTSSVSLLTQCKLGSLPQFPSKVIIFLEIKEEVAWFHLNFIRAILPGDVRVFGGEGRRKKENFPFEGQIRASVFSSSGSRLFLFGKTRYNPNWHSLQPLSSFPSSFEFHVSFVPPRMVSAHQRDPGAVFTVCFCSD